MPISRSKHRLRDICLSNSQPMVTSAEIYLGVDSCPSQLIKQIINSRKRVPILDSSPIQSLLVIHSRRVLSFFLTNKTEAPQGEVLGLIKPLSNNSYTWTLSSCNTVGTILCGVIEMSDVPGCNSMVKSTSLYGGYLGSSSEKTSSYSQTTRGTPKSRLTSSSKVRLARQPTNRPCHLESFTNITQTSSCM